MGVTLRKIKCDRFFWPFNARYVYLKWSRVAIE